MSRSFFLGSLWVTEFPNETRMALFCFKPLSVTRNQRRNAIDHQVGNNSSLQAAWSGRSQSDAVRHSWNGPKKPWWGIIQMDWAQRFYIYVNESKRKMIFRECQNSFIKKCNNIFFVVSSFWSKKKVIKWNRHIRFIQKVWEPTFLESISFIMLIFQRFSVKNLQ